MKICANCGVRMRPSGAVPKGGLSYCSVGACKAANAVTRRERLGKQVGPIVPDPRFDYTTCTHCGGPAAMARSAADGMTYCSKTPCRSAAGKARRAPVPPRYCSHCGILLPPRGAVGRDGTRYCQAIECQRARNRKRQCDFVARKKAEGIDVYAPYREGIQARLKARIKSGEKLSARKDPARHETFRAADERRRARKVGATVEIFTRLEVLERDGWVCGICRGPVDKLLAYPDPWSASLDHVIPLSKGGAHSRANTQCAHLRCNVRKSATIPS